MSAHNRYSQDDDENEPLNDIQARLQADRHDAAMPLPAHPHNAVMRQPLLENVYHEYRDEKEEEEDYWEYEQESPGCCDFSDEESFLNRKGRSWRFWGAMIGVALLVFAFVHYIVYPEIVDERMRSGFINQVEDGEVKLNTIGLAMGGQFQHGAVKIQDLDEMFIPGGENDPHGNRRLVFVGDIHGCRDELKALLDKVNFDPKHDHLIAAGDTINKGPHSAAVLDHLIHLNATTVRGNHEDRLIHTAKTVYDTFSSLPEASQPTLQDTDSLVSTTNVAHRDARTLKTLHRRHLHYIQQMPLILRIHPLPQAGKPTASTNSPIAEPILVVHAGLVPALPLEKQDPYFVTNMRSLHATSHVPSADRAGRRGGKVGKYNRPWRNVWGWYNDHLFRHKSTRGFRKFSSPAQGASTESLGFFGRMWDSAESSVREYAGRAKNGDKPKVVVYGHDSKGGLRIKRWSKGLDSGCVGGGKLSALVVDAKGLSEVVDVDCPGYW